MRLSKIFQLIGDVIEAAFRDTTDDAERTSSPFYTHHDESAPISRAENDLTGEYNWRTRKFDNGLDPHGWYDLD